MASTEQQSTEQPGSVLSEQKKMDEKVVLKAKSDSCIDAINTTESIFRSRPSSNAEPVEEIEYNFNVELPLEEFCDVEIKLGEDVFNAHRVHLAQHSAYFRDLIEDKASSYVSLDLTSETWINTAVLRMILQWIYTDEIPLCMSNFTAVSSTAKKLKMEGLLLTCDRFLSQLCERRGPLLVLQQATNKKIKKIQEYAKRYAERNFPTVTKGRPFLDCDAVEAVIWLLLNDNLAVPNEKCVFDAATAWLKARWRTRRNHVGAIMKCVRFPLMDLEELQECCLHGNRFIVEHPSVFRPFLKSLLYHLSLKRGLQGQHKNLNEPCKVRHYSFAMDFFREFRRFGTGTGKRRASFELDHAVSLGIKT